MTFEIPFNDKVYQTSRLSFFINITTDKLREKC